MILVTFPPGVSRWLGQDLPSRVRRAFGLPLSHLVAAAPVLHHTGRVTAQPPLCRKCSACRTSRRDSA